jgi:hypothetical protein
MFPVEIHASHDASLMRMMHEMREWLDHRHYEPTVFRSETNDSGWTVRLQFRSQEEALSFARQFAGNRLDATPTG